MFISYDMSIFARKIKEIRKELSLTQLEVQESTGIHTDTIRRFEKGETIPNYDTIEKLSLFYGLDLLNVLNKCKIDITLQDIYDDIDEIIINNQDNITQELHNKIEAFYLNSKISNLVRPVLLDQCRYFFKLLEIFKSNKYNAIHLTILFKECLAMTCSKKKSNTLSHLELRIKLIIALLKVEQKRYEESNDILISITKNMESMNIILGYDQKLYIKCISNLAFNYNDMRMDYKALEIANKGITYCQKNEVIYLLYLLYGRKAIAKFKLGHNDYHKDMVNSICLLDITGHEKLKQQYIDVFVGEYGMEIGSIIR